MPCNCPPGPHRPQLAQQAGPPAPCKDPQVIAVSSLALSGFRLRPPAVAVQEDSFKSRVFVLVSVTAGALEPRSASFPGIEVRAQAGANPTDDACGNHYITASRHTVPAA